MSRWEDRPASRRSRFRADRGGGCKLRCRRLPVDGAGSAGRCGGRARRCLAGCGAGAGKSGGGRRCDHLLRLSFLQSAHARG